MIHTAKQLSGSNLSCRVDLHAAPSFFLFLGAALGDVQRNGSRPQRKRRALDAVIQFWTYNRSIMSVSTLQELSFFYRRRNTVWNGRKRSPELVVNLWNQHEISGPLQTVAGSRGEELNAPDAHALPRKRQREENRRGRLEVG